MRTITILANTTNIDSPMVDLSETPFHLANGLIDLDIGSKDIPLVSSYYELPEGFQGLYAQGSESDYRLMIKDENGDVEIIHEFEEVRFLATKE